MSNYKKYIRGTNGNDLLVGDANNNKLYGKGGDDELQGLGGNDRLWGGRGDDSIDGGTGKDLAFGGAGDDTLLGGDGNDVLFGDNARPAHHGFGYGYGHHHSHDHGYHGYGKGGGWRASGGDDVLDGGAGNDLLFGQGGNDRGIYNVTENLGASDRYDGGKGVDTLVLELTQAQWQDPAVQNDIAAYQAFLEQHTNPHTGKADGHSFSFSAFDLTVSRWEKLEVLVEDADQEPDDSIVVFDLTAGTSSEHSERSFSADASYDIYIVVDSNSSSILQNSPWSGAGNLGSDDTIHLVGNGTPILGLSGNSITGTTGAATFGSPSYLTPSNLAAYIPLGGTFSRFAPDGISTADIYLTGSHAVGINFAFPTLTTLPASIAATQSLS